MKMKVKIKEGKFNDFSYARNKSIKMATCDYVFWADHDDYVDHPCALKDCIYKYPDIDAFKLTVHSYTSYKGEELIFQNRLLKNHDWLEFRNSVHEDISFSTKEHDAKVVSTDIVIHHLGNMKMADVKKKNQRNLKLVLEDLKRPSAHNLTYFAVVNCLMIEGGYDNCVKAILYIDECFQRFEMKDDDPLTSKMWVLRGLCAMDCNQLEAAKTNFNKAFSLCVHPEAGVNLAEIYMKEQNYNKAIEVLEQIYSSGGPKVGSIPFDIKNVQWLLLTKLGFSYFCKAEGIIKMIPTLNVVKNLEQREEMKKFAKMEHKICLENSEKYLRECLSINSKNLEAADRLCDVLRKLGKINDANFVTINLVNMFPGYSVGWQNLGNFELMNKRYRTAQMFLRRARELDPKNKIIRHNLINIERALRSTSG